MPKPIARSVNEYIGLQPDPVRGLLSGVRDAILHALPQAEETISYGIPSYKLQGRAVIYFAAWKKHYSMYPVTESLLTALGEDVASYEVEKGTIRFPLSEPAPLRLIGRIAKFRAKEAAERSTRGAAAPDNSSSRRAR